MYNYPLPSFLPLFLFLFLSILLPHPLPLLPFHSYPPHLPQPNRLTRLH